MAVDADDFRDRVFLETEVAAAVRGAVRLRVVVPITPSVALLLRRLVVVRRDVLRVAVFFAAGFFAAAVLVVLRARFFFGVSDSAVDPVVLDIIRSIALVVC